MNEAKVAMYWLAGLAGLEYEVRAKANKLKCDLGNCIFQ